MSKELDGYLAEIAKQLSVDPTTEKEILREIQVHLEDAASELEEGGLDRQESVAAAIGNFGEAREVGRMLGLLHSDSANQAVLAAFLPVALALTFKGSCCLCFSVWVIGRAVPHLSSSPLWPSSS